MGSLGDSQVKTAGRFLIPGEASGDVVFSNTPISFMMGVDAATGVVIDKHHPLSGTPTTDKIVALPRGRGSCSGSSVILELLLNEVAPAALIFKDAEEILTLGVLLAKVMYSKSIPVVHLEDPALFASLENAKTIAIREGKLVLDNSQKIMLSSSGFDEVSLTDGDRDYLNGKNCSEAARMAMEVLVQYSAITKAANLIDVSQVHIDACCWVGRTSLLVPQDLVNLGAKFVVPATCNSLDVDKQRWRELGSDPEFSQTASKIGDLYLEMGATMSFTCAPYLLDSKPKKGEQVGWGESNAVVYANSVLGARTQKYPDFLDVMMALTGRAPNAGCHLTEGRRPRLVFTAPELPGWEDSLFPLLGYHIGEMCGSSIPFIYGLEKTAAGVPDLKAFGAGFATTSAAPMFHINGITSEAEEVSSYLEGLEHTHITAEDLAKTFTRLTTAKSLDVDLVSLGNPHFALQEFERLVKLTKGRKKHDKVAVVITTSRFVYGQAAKKGWIDEAERFGAQLITDTCWCMIKEPVIPLAAKNIMTHSSKYAHYGPGTTKRGLHFGSMAASVDAACTSARTLEDLSPRWLFGASSN